MIEYLKFGIFVTLTDIPALIVSFDFSSWSRGIINAYCIALLCISLCKKNKKNLQLCIWRRSHKIGSFLDD